MSKQTAVTWIIGQIVEDQTIKAKSITEWIDIFEKAKAMHKAEIIEAFDFGDYNIDLPDGTWEQKYKSAEQYYNETFNNNEQVN